MENILCIKYIITIVISVSVIKVKFNDLPYMFFFCSFAHVTQLKLERLTFVVMQNCSLVDYILCHEICEKI